MRGKWIYTSIFGFTLGVGVRSLYPSGETSVLGGMFVFAFFLLLTSVLLVCLSQIQRIKKKPYQTVFLIALVFFSSAVGVARFDSANMHRGDVFLDTNIGSRIVIEGIVVDEPDERENNTKLVVVFEKNIKSRAVITVDTYPRYLYGDKIHIEGVLQKPRAFTGDNGKTFDYPAFLAKDNIYYQMFFPDLTLVSTGNGNPIKKNIVRFKTRVARECHASYSRPTCVTPRRTSGGSKALTRRKTAG